ELAANLSALQDSVAAVLVSACPSGGRIGVAGALVAPVAPLAYAGVLTESEVAMLFLTEEDVRELFPMAQAIERIEASFLAQARGQAVNRSRERIFLPQTSLHYMAAALLEENLVGMKIYTASRAAWRFVVLLYDGASGELLATLEADHLGRIRTGAATGVATKYL